MKLFRTSYSSALVLFVCFVAQQRGFISNVVSLLQHKHPMSVFPKCFKHLQNTFLREVCLSCSLKHITKLFSLVYQISFWSEVCLKTYTRSGELCQLSPGETTSSPGGVVLPSGQDNAVVSAGSIHPPSQTWDF